MSDGSSFLPQLGMDSLARAKSLEQTRELKSIKKTLESKPADNQPGSKAAKDKEIESAAAQFEGLLIQQMLKSMWETVPKDGLLSGGRDEELYRDMLHQAYAEQMSEGQGIGIKELIVKELKARESS